VIGARTSGEVHHIYIHTVRILDGGVFVWYVVGTGLVRAHRLAMFATGNQIRERAKQAGGDTVRVPCQTETNNAWLAVFCLHADS
jgi:hypothetical protein